MNWKLDLTTVDKLMTQVLDLTHLEAMKNIIEKHSAEPTLPLRPNSTFLHQDPQFTSRKMYENVFLKKMPCVVKNH